MYGLGDVDADNLTEEKMVEGNHGVSSLVFVVGYFGAGGSNRF